MPYSSYFDECLRASAGCLGFLLYGCMPCLGCSIAVCLGCGDRSY